MLVFDKKFIGRGWEAVCYVDNPRHPDFKKIPYIRTLDQYYSIQSEEWKAGSMFTYEKFPYSGKTPYRRPVSFFAHLSAIFPGWFQKVWRRKVEILWRKNFE